MPRHFTLLLGGVCVLLWTASAHAQGRGGMSGMFDRYDRNGDGVLTSDEVPEQARGFLTRMGLDLDQGIRREEIEQATQQVFSRFRQQGVLRRSRDRADDRDAPPTFRGSFEPSGSSPGDEAGETPRFPGVGESADFQDGFDDRNRGRPEAFAQGIIAQQDRDGDGVLALEEMPDWLAQDFDRLDTSGDGLIEAAELAERFPAARSQPPREAPSAAGPERSSPFSRGPRYAPGLPSWFQQSDRNTDGQVAMYEWDRRQLSEFERLDRNQDGFLTSDEVLRAATAPRDGAIGAGPAGFSAFGSGSRSTRRGGIGEGFRFGRDRGSRGGSRFQDGSFRASR